MGKQKKSFDDLTWQDLNEWAGSRIVNRGRDYQRRGLVSDMAMSGGGLIAWVDGSECYATQVTMNDDGPLDSLCTCPYEVGCKHGVAVVLEYLECLENNKPVPAASENDKRLTLLAEDDWNNEDESHLSGDTKRELEPFLKGRTKAQLVELILELTRRHPEIEQSLADRSLLSAGDSDAIVARLRREIREIGDEPGWQNYWQDEGYTPDYSGIRSKLEALLKAGEADKALALGEELLNTGISQAEESQDEGETAMEVAACMPILVRILEASSLGTADKLFWAVEAVFKDPFDLCEDFAEYLHKQHTRKAWNKFADGLLKRLNSIKGTDTFSRNYDRDQISNWAIHALDRANREDEIIPLCIAEAQITGSYERLVSGLIDVKCFDEAERWVHEGIKATKKESPGISSGLRDRLKNIQAGRNNWGVVAAIESDKFVDRPCLLTFGDCKKAATKVKEWSMVRQCLLTYLEKGALPQKQKEWPLPPSGLDKGLPRRKDRYPMTDVLIDIAIHEKKPGEVLKWYDKRPTSSYGWYGSKDDEIAMAVRDYAPDRAVEIWKKLAEQLIAQVKPSAYEEAAKYLHKAADVMSNEKKEDKWKQYMNQLRGKHMRKHRLIEILDGMANRPILKGRR